MRYLYSIIFITLTLLLSGCGFHIQNQITLVPPLKRMYVQSVDPYGSLARSLQDYLKMSNVQLVSCPADARTVLVILQDTKSEELLSVSSTQQTRQYNLHVTVSFEITDPIGQILVPPQHLTETRVITVQSNQIMGNSNEANLYYQQMRRALAYAIMNRIASREISAILMTAAYPPRKL